MTKKRGSKAAISSTPTSKPLHIIDPRPSTIATDEQMRALRSEGELYYWGKVEPAKRFDLPNTNFGLLRDPTLPKYEDIAIELYNLKNPTKKTEVIKEPTQLSSPSNEILEDHVRRNKEFALKTLKENQEYKTKLQQKNEELEQLTKKMEDRFAVITASLEQHRCVIENLTEENKHLKCVLEKQTNDIEALSKENKQLKCIVEKQTKDIEALSKENKQLKSIVEEVKMKVDKMNQCNYSKRLLKKCSDRITINSNWKNCIEEFINGHYSETLCGLVREDVKLLYQFWKSTKNMRNNICHEKGINEPFVRNIEKILDTEPQMSSDNLAQKLN